MKQGIMMTNMEITIDSQLATSAVSHFLKSQFDKKSEKEQKQLTKAKEDNDIQKITELTEKIADIQAKFTADVWLANATEKMAKQLKFGTHTSKGIHPDAKGDNIIFQPSPSQKKALPKHIVGSHSIDSDYLDANGNAAALPLATFFDFTVSDSIKIRDLILKDNQDFITSLSANSEQAQRYHQAFKDALRNQVDNPVSHERNKQTLWAINPYYGLPLEQLNYTAIIPLYPSVLTFKVFQTINELRYSDANKTARENRFKKTVEPQQQQAYVSLLNLATVQLGGTKPQNVSLLTSKQGGRNYLLPSLPPPSIAKALNLQEDEDHYRPSKFASSIFNGKQLIYQCQKDIQRIFSVVEDARNIVDVRDKRKDALDAVLQNLFRFADYMRTQLPAGWTKDYELAMHQKLWLDPMRAELAGEEVFFAERAKKEWIEKVIDDFASWMNVLLQAEFPKYKADFSDPEFIEWEKEIEDMKKRYERAGKGVFL